MRGLLCLLAVALLAAMPAHCRRLKQWGSPSAGPTQQCIASFNTMVQSGLCGQGSPMPVCCSAMAAVGNSCLDAMEAAMAQDPRNYGQLLDITKSLRSQCTGTSAGSGIGSGPGTGAGSGIGSGPGTSAGSSIGSGPGTSAGSGIGSGPGTGAGSGIGSGPGTGAGSGIGPGAGSRPTSQCITSFNALLQSGMCGPASTPPQCCAALAQVGSACLDSIEADMAMQGAQYAQMLQTTKALRSQCGTRASWGPAEEPGSDAGSVNVDECLSGLTVAINGACTSLSPCCVALEGLGTGCLTWFLEEVKDEVLAHDAFATLLQSCGMASASSSTRAAPQDEAATQALTRLQQAGVPKVAAAPQAAHSAAFQPDWHLDAPAAVEQRSAFSPDMLVKA